MRYQIGDIVFPCDGKHIGFYWAVVTDWGHSGIIYAIYGVAEGLVARKQENFVVGIQTFAGVIPCVSR